MKIWGVLCLLGFTSELNAHTMDGADRSEGREERASVGIPTHFDDESPKDASSKDHKAESSSVLRESSENIASSKEEIEKPDPYMIIVSDKLSPPGGGVPSLDPKIVSEMVLPPFPEAEAPWWERWWKGVSEWFFGDKE
jgi:hypothetical protein